MLLKLSALVNSKISILIVVLLIPYLLHDKIICKSPRDMMVLNIFNTLARIAHEHCVNLGITI
jgi:hypothetical protein